MIVVAVQILRAAAALMVAWHHARHEVALLADRGAGPALDPATLLPWWGGVDLFFVISGFVIVHAGGRLAGRPGGRVRFLAHRVARVVPLYWLVSLLYLVLALARPDLLGDAAALVRDPLALVASFLFWPAARPDGTVQPLYGLGWTLNYEAAFYVLFAAGLGFGLRGAVAWLCGSLAGLVAVGALVPNLPVPLRFWSDPIVLEFAAGAGLALAWGAGFRPALLLVAAALGRPRDAAAVARLPFPLRGLVEFGDASYALYLVHPFALRLVREVLLRLGLAPALHPWGSMALMLAGSVAAALVIHRLVERPLTRALRRRLDPGAPQNRVRAVPAPVPPGGRAD
ncbi:acyltransferase [Methylobacterium mesophilicum]|uniref:acyltransferase family protein n=1 Tax=Methylobacterium mesophilicum TaxID=39956 RepID=UPI002F2E32F4